MPVIVYKTMTIDALWLQPRRIACDGCGQPFVYLARGSQSTQVTGVPVLSDEQDMQRSAADALEKRLAKVGLKHKQGEGMCPHCHVYQHWMVASSRLWKYGKGIGIGGGVGLCVALLCGFLGEMPRMFGGIGRLFAQVTHSSIPGLGWFVFLLMGVVGAGIGAAFMHRKVIRRGPHTGMVDPSAMTDEAWINHLAGCAERDYQPALAWWAMIGGTFPEKLAVVPLEPYDAVDG